MRFVIFFSIYISFGQLVAQDAKEYIVDYSKYFKVEFDKFSPPLQAMIEANEGKPAKNFMMKDLNGKDFTVNSFKGSKQVLFFFDNQPKSLELINSIIAYAEGSNKLKFLGLFNPVKAELKSEFSKLKNVTILPNAEFLGQAAYDNELGNPRIYLIDDKGIVKMVIPEIYMANMLNVMDAIDNFANNKLY